MKNEDIKSTVSVALSKILEVTNVGIVSISPSKELKTLIFTNFGHIETDSIELVNNTSLEDLDPVETFLRGAVIKVEDPGQRDLILLLRNAKITPFGYKDPQHTVTHMLLFSDQIVGLSFK